MKKIFASILTLATMIAFSGVAHADTAYKPQLVGTVTINPVGNSPETQKWTLMATGSQAPLGDFSYQSNLVVHNKNGQPDFAEGQGTFTGVGSATGDSINFNLKLMFSAPSASNPNVYPFTGTFTVTGGTGRFQGVHGEGTINPGGVNPTAGTFFGNWDGTIGSRTF